MKTKILLAVIIFLGVSLRIFYALNLPLSGDESISLLQSTGHATERNVDDFNKVISSKKVKTLIQHDTEHPVSGVFTSLIYAGMHPPFYYVILHYVLQFFGNDYFTVRLLSVVFSTLSIAAIYFLGKIIYNRQAGVCAAVFLAISAYPITFGPMVRPYPMALLLGLVTTFQVYNLGRKTTLKLLNLETITYIVMVTAGLYTIYNFIFIFFFQFIFLSICNLKHRKNLSVIIFMAIVAFCLYLPWLPSFFTQLNKASSEEFYFHGKTSLLSLADYVVSFNFTRQLPGRYAWYKFIVIACVCAAMSLGLGCLIRKRIRRNLVMALGVYLLLYYTAEVLMGTKTLNSPKQLSFIIGISLLLAALGISSIITRFKATGILLCIVFCFVMLCNSICICRNKIIYDGPEYLLTFPKIINTALENNPKGLIICNTFRGRYLLSFIHAIEQPTDIVVIPSKRIENHSAVLTSLDNYDTVAIAELFKPQSQEQHPKEKYATILLEHLKSKGFVPADTYSTKNQSQSSQLMICYRKSRTTPAIFQKND